MGAQLRVDGVRHYRGGHEVLHVDSLDIHDGEQVCVLGPNGAGKTTLLRLLAAAERPHTGRVSVDGTDIEHGGIALRRRAAYATQRPGLLSTSVARNVTLPLAWRKVPRKRRRDLADDALRLLGVAHLADRQAAGLSGGEQQRVNLARALAIDPDVLLLDEPAASLDAESRLSFLHDLGRALTGRTTTVVHVSHRADDALRLADRAIALVDGNVWQDDTADAVIRRPADANVAALVGYDNLLDAHVRTDGEVTVRGEHTGLPWHGEPGPVVVAAFATGVCVGSSASAGVPARVERVVPGPGYRTVVLEGNPPLLASIPLRAPAPSAGQHVRISFDPDLSRVLPRSVATHRGPAPAPAPSPRVPAHAATASGT
ncbi:iron(III) transport system ATP-binding protein/tungstate transport system ATP-binding protein [Haloechinothrix alba]|uniref:Iron(III) transport system ATP-binding protein/tungstate transport system ATP-binding protein n=1 Tax=Haloechinothrix alba TaxID=664784 RepID=A0A238YQ26_9PSEU|nr:ABC transporter ATP-binding protein [Haloechinothrix alba]SNR73092.1 iron(III) transport system ATP-binding protein/tungstate transport system ATP-binding protein [Haloechinothrix alba]